ncbi:PIN-like domain-containing protein [Neobacillus niacini]|uniref:PIN-like domain-containing protein n=1 Tax=Neobacillus niacini TaxID=86668 RepID=UPI0021CB1472|nr:PIN-like domain-containing protein [Neobacillus niacini]MCM3767032.1 PIN-like domain-containing protein [Neobacillus niacini]
MTVQPLYNTDFTRVLSIFVVDTNILINFYKYTSKESTKSLLGILKKLKENDRLWIPHQVALEYFFNYEGNMHKQKEGYDLLENELKKLKEDAEKRLEAVKRNHPYIDIKKFHFIFNDIEQSNSKVQEQIIKEITNLPDPKAIQQDLLNLLDGIIGEPYPQEKINAIETEGKERYQYDVPPGFKDKKDKEKQDFRTYGDFRYQQLYGDLIVWNQIMDRAKREGNQTPIILITEDRKEDWWEKESGKIKGPHPQLIQEFINETQQKFYMYRTDNFVRYAFEYLGADISEAQIQEVTNEVENIRRYEEFNENKLKIQKATALNKVTDYLTEDEKNVFFQMVEQSNDLELDSFTANYKYGQAVKWAFRTALPKIEKKFQDLVILLSTLNAEKGHLGQHFYNSLSEDTDERVLKLLNEMPNIKSTINFYKAFPDGHL